MLTTSKKKATLVGAAIIALAGLTIAASTNSSPSKETQPREALAALVGEWSGDSVVYLSPGLPPTLDTATQSSQKLGNYWVSSLLEMTYLGEPYSEMLVLTVDGTTKLASGTIYASNDAIPRPVTGTYNTRSGVWELFHETLNAAGMVVAAKTSISVNRRQRSLALERVHLLENGFEALALEVHSSLRGR